MTVGKDVATIVEERAAVLTYARRFNLAVVAHIAAGRLSSETGTDIQRTIRTFAGDVAVGLHRDGNDPDGVGSAMRPIVEAHRAQASENPAK